MTPTTPKVKPTKPAHSKAAPKRPAAKRAAPVHAATKPTVHKTTAAHEATKTPAAQRSYNFISTVGRRKSAVARVRLHQNGTGKVMINERELTKYFPTFDQQNAALLPLKVTSMETSVDVGVKVAGGGSRGQADAVKHGIARALLLLNEDYRRPLRAAGCLTRDSRVKERKKYGLKKARRAPQFSKR